MLSSFATPTAAAPTLGAIANAADLAIESRHPDSRSGDNWPAGNLLADNLLADNWPVGNGRASAPIAAAGWQEQLQIQLENAREVADLVKGSIDNPPTQDDLMVAIERWREILSDGRVSDDELALILQSARETVERLGVTLDEAHDIWLAAQDFVADSQIPQSDDLLTGTNGSDALWGGGGNDTLIGGSAIANPGEVDLLIGGAGADVFVLGDATGTFYNDGVARLQGTADYAILADFDPTADRAVLHGSAEDYQLGEVPASFLAAFPNFSGSAIYRLGEPQPELVAVAVGNSAAELQDQLGFV